MGDTREQAREAARALRRSHGRALALGLDLVGLAREYPTQALDAARREVRELAFALDATAAQLECSIGAPPQDRDDPRPKPKTARDHALEDLAALRRRAGGAR